MHYVALHHWSKYHLNTFNIANNEGVNEWVGDGATKKTQENVMKLGKSRL